MRYYHSVAWLLFPFLLAGQLITTDPAVPTLDQPLTITFDATEGTGGLENCGCDVYIHTGVLTDQSTSSSDWQYVQTTWGVANNDWKLSPVDGEPNKYTYTFGSTVLDYFDPAPGETIDKIALVFRNANGSLEGKAEGGNDIFIDVLPGGDVFSVSLNADPGDGAWPLGQPLTLTGGASAEGTLVIYDNDVEVARFTDADAFTYDLIFTTAGSHTVRLDATNPDGATATSSFDVEAALTVDFTAPEADVYQAAQGEMLSISASAYVAASVSLTESISEIATGITEINTTVNLSDAGIRNFTVTAIYQGDTVQDQLAIIVGSPEVADPPPGFDRGITVTENGLFLQLYAPGKEDIFVIGNFNDWTPDASSRMKRSQDGTTFWTELTNITEDDLLFQYLVDLDLRVADPYSTLVLDRWNDPFIEESVFAGIPEYPIEMTDGIISWVRMNVPEYQWGDDDFTPIPADEHTVYELLLRDFLEDHSYKSLIDTLDYLDRLGVTAIELMPVNEFEGNISWGYNPSFHMALDKYYGSPEDFKAFVDACHARGISVLLDVVYNHAFSQSSLAQLWWDQDNFRPALDNPYLNPVPRHPFNVGYDFNHQSAATRDYVKVTLAHWLEEYHVDGFRFDLSKGFTQIFSDNDGFFRRYEPQRIAVLKEYADLCWSVNDEAMVILEHFAEEQEEDELARHGNGIYFWSGSNPHGQYQEAAMGYTSDLRSALSENRGFTSGRPLVAYIESHDEERTIYKTNEFGASSTSGYDITELPTGLDRAALTHAFFLTLPGPKMIWQFGELGYDFPINYCPGGGVDEGCRTDPKPIRWDYRDDLDRQDLYNTIQALLFLRHNYGTFHGDDYSVSLTGRTKRIQLAHPDFDAAIVGNFGVTPLEVLSPFPSAGTWYDYLNGESVNVSNPDAGIMLQPGEFRVYLSREIARPSPGLTVSVEEVVAAEELGMVISPNPSDGMFRLAYDLPAAARVEVQLLDIMGRPVKQLSSSDQVAGEHNLNVSLNVPAGVYFVRLSAGRKIAARRVIVR